jgi:hypothetical protein
MAENEQNRSPRTTEIPPIFWSDAEAAPFENCINCQCDLLESNAPYMIEKAVRGFDGEKVSATIFEYAVCMNCAQKMNMKLSVQSRQRIEAYFHTHVDFKERSKQLQNESDEAWLQNCLVHHKPVNQEGECQLYALCQGNQFVYQEFPYMIRAEALDEMMDLISAETLRQLDDFKDDLIDGPPELKELFEKGGPKVLL